MHSTNKPSLQTLPTNPPYNQWKCHHGKTSGESDLKNVMSLGIIGVMKKILGKIFEKVQNSKIGRFLRTTSAGLAKVNFSYI